MPEIHRLADDCISVYLRTLRNGSCYYARFKIKNRRVANGQRYVTESMRTMDLAIAEDRARQRYVEIEQFEQQGRALRSGTVAEEIDAFCDDYSANLKQGISGYSPHMYRGFRRTIVRYFREYLGAKALQDVDQQDLQEYEVWRQSYWERKVKKGVRLHGNAKHRASSRTLEWEVNAFKQFLRWASARGRYSGNATEFKFRVPTKERRAAFTNVQWTRLTGYMRRAKWLAAGKHSHDRRMRRYRLMLQAYVLFMGNTGLRVGEARNLKWKDCVLVNAKDDLDRKVRIAVASAHSKVKKRRTVIGTPGAYSALKRLLDDRAKTQDNVRKDDYIWCDADGTPIGDFREGFNSLLRHADVEHDGDGRKHVIYSLRHTYITFRLKKNVDIYQLAANCGTSVAMIEKYYSDARSTDFERELTKGYRQQPR